MNFLDFLSGLTDLGLLWEKITDPNEWKTDRKSILLIVVGIPVGVMLLYGGLTVLMSLIK